MKLKRKTCPDCGRNQGSHTQWLNNQKLCAAHTGASDALLSCLTSTVALLRSDLRSAQQENVALLEFVNLVHAALKSIEEPAAVSAS